jgi:hypothetical protein
MRVSRIWLSLRRFLLRMVAATNTAKSGVLDFVVTERINQGYAVPSNN